MSSTSNYFVDRPVFAGFLFDCSGSMQQFQDDVIAGHKLMLSTLREAEKCEKGVLYIYQSLFADTVRHLQPFYALDSKGNDQIVSLTRSNYQPGGNTALYDALITVAKELETQ